MRTNKELVKMLRDSIANQKSIASGLCLEARYLYDEKIISLWEFDQLNTFLTSHRPKKGKHFMKERKYLGWWWNPQEVKPRLDWLNDKLKHWKKEWDNMLEERK